VARPPSASLYAGSSAALVGEAKGAVWP